MSSFEISENLKALLPFSYIFPTYILYFDIFYIIFASKNKSQFYGSFWKLYGITCVINCCGWLIYYIGMRVPNAPIFLSFVKIWGIRSIFITLLYSVLWYQTFVAHILNAVLSFNRFSVFFLKLEYQRFWKKYLKYFVFSCLCFPLLLVFHIPFTDVYMKLKNESYTGGLRTFSQLKSMNISWMNNHRNAAIIITLSSIVSLICNIYVVYFLVKQRFYKDNSLTLLKSSSQDVKLSIFTMVMFFVELTSVIQQYAFISVTDDRFIAIMYDIQYYIVDVMFLAFAWFIIVAHGNLRRQTIFYCIFINSQTTVTPFSKQFS